MIYSRSFDDLNSPARERVLRGLYDALRAKGAGGAAAINIVAATRPGLAAYWKPVAEADARTPKTLR
jgi:hypothetical protein